MDPRDYEPERVEQVRLETPLGQPQPLVPGPMPDLAAQPFATALEEPERWDGGW